MEAKEEIMVVSEFNNSEKDLFEDIEIRNLLNSLDDGVFVVDKNDVLVFYNHSASLVLKTNLDGLLNTNINKIYYFQCLFNDRTIPSHIRDLASGYKISNIYKIDEKTYYFENERIDLYDGYGKIKGTLYLVRDITKEISLEISLSNEIKSDSLSGLFNSRCFYENIDKEISRGSRYGLDLSLIFMDINNFKFFNDTLGHKTGDEIIRFTGETLKKSIRKNIDSAYRYGGDEFVIILPNTPAKRSTIVANRILSIFQSGFNDKLKVLISGKVDIKDLNLDSFIFNDNKSKKIGLSIGISEYQQGKSVNELIKEADAAMYKAKKESGFSFCIYE